MDFATALVLANNSKSVRALDRSRTPITRSVVLVTSWTPTHRPSAAKSRLGNQTPRKDVVSRWQSTWIASPDDEGTNRLVKDARVYQKCGRLVYLCRVHFLSLDESVQWHLISV